MFDYRLGRGSEAADMAAMSRDLVEHGLGWSWTESRIRRKMVNPDAVVLVAADEGRMADFAIMEFAEEHAHLNLLAVRPSYQRKAVGRGLIEWLEASVTVAGITSIFVEVRTRNSTGRLFYRALGYRELAFLPGYYAAGESGIRMLRDPAWQRSAVRPLET